MLPVNLYFTPDGKTALRYWLKGGIVGERTVPFPAALLTLPPDSRANVRPRVLRTPEDVLFEVFRGLPLCPEGNWALDETGFSSVFRNTFAALLRMLRRPPERRWCVRGEPGWFLQFGLREDSEAYTMGAFVQPCGKPAVLTFRAEDLLRALPPSHPFTTVDIDSEADGLPPEISPAQPWDTRIRLPIADRGAACVTLTPTVGNV